MYTRIKKEKEIFLDSAAIVRPIVTLKDECGGKCHIIIDDACYVVCIENEEGVSKPTTHIFNEVLEVLKELPPPH